VSRKLSVWNLRHLAGLAVLALAWAQPIAAAEIDLNVGSDALRIGYVRPVGDKGLELDFSYLNDKEIDVGGVGLHMVDDAVGNSNWRVGLGGKVFILDADFDEAAAVGLGGHVRYRWPGVKAAEIGASLYWAPDAATFDKAEEYLEADIRLAYTVIERAALYVGARTIRVEFEGFPSETIDSVHIGFRIHY
jgi:hypothetical protein